MIFSPVFELTESLPKIAASRLHLDARLQGERKRDKQRQTKTSWQVGDGVGPRRSSDLLTASDVLGRRHVSIECVNDDSRVSVCMYNTCTHVIASPSTKRRFSPAP